MTGTFKYNGVSSTCTSAVVSTIVNNGNWKISEKSSYKTANKATARAIVKQYAGGLVVNTISKSVTLTCDNNGGLS